MNLETHFDYMHRTYDFWQHCFSPTGLGKDDFLLFDILKGLAYIHKMDEIHRDIKPANGNTSPWQTYRSVLLVRDAWGYYRLKIADFGYTSFGESGKNYSSVQGRSTPIYCAPELLVRGKYSKKSDIWAFGCIFYESLFKCLDRRRAFASIPAITSYFHQENIPPPQMSWQTVGITPHHIPMQYRGEKEGVERAWDFVNIILAAIFRRNPDERPSVSLLLENFNRISKAKPLTIPDYRPSTTNDATAS